MYKEKLDELKKSFYCKQSSLTSKFAKDLRTGTCHKRYGHNATIVEMYLSVVMPYKVAENTITSAFFVTVTKEEGVSENVEIKIGNDTLAITSSNAPQFLLGEIKKTIEDNTGFNVDVFSGGFIAYSYSSDYDDNTTFTVDLSQDGEAVVENITDTSESILLKHWNCLEFKDVKTMIEHGLMLTSKKSKCY